MQQRAIIPSALKNAAKSLNMSPAIVSGDHLYLTGATGGEIDGTMPIAPQRQFRNCFDKIGLILNEADVSFGSIVEMTTYHVGLRDHFDVFDKIRLEYLRDPYPAWTAVEVAGLRREGAIVEIRIIANINNESQTEYPL